MQGNIVLITFENEERPLTEDRISSHSNNQ